MLCIRYTAIPRLEYHLLPKEDHWQTQNTTINKYLKTWMIVTFVLCGLSHTSHTCHHWYTCAYITNFQKKGKKVTMGKWAIRVYICKSTSRFTLTTEVTLETGNSRYIYNNLTNQKSSSSSSPFPFEGNWAFTNQKNLSFKEWLLEYQGMVLKMQE